MLTDNQRSRLNLFCAALIDQEAARVVVAPQQAASGFWFGGGNLAEAPDGAFYLCGRYRNAGDSRTGLGAGERGLELAVFDSRDRGQHFDKLLAFSKADLSYPGGEVLSIEGSALHFTDDGVELFVSSEKADVYYPAHLSEFQKPGTGVWTIDVLRAPTVEALRDATPTPLLRCDDPRFLHVKDPVVYKRTNGDLVLVFCTHPFNWSSSNSAYAVRPAGSDAFEPPVYDFFARGVTWDVAMSRMTALLDVPQIGAFAQDGPRALAFYDGGESLRQYEEHGKAVRRARGYSCEEIGGVAVLDPADLGTEERLSLLFPSFVSPTGTGCSRYVDVLTAAEGYYVTWQQSQVDLSQPLVMNFVSKAEAERILVG
ncbi:MAG: hypothetical protein R2873_07040 [Caldilineaceae bacterium]|nr:hypothetical protein [Caldilineaceae bacterium]